MPEVGDRALAEGALAAFDEEGVATERPEHGMQVPKMIYLGAAVNKNIIKKYQDEPP